MMDDVKMTLSIKSKYRMSSWDNCCDDVGNKCWAETASGRSGQLRLFLARGATESFPNPECKGTQKEVDGHQLRNAAGKVSFGSDASFWVQLASPLPSHTHIHR